MFSSIKYLVGFYGVGYLRVPYSPIIGHPMRMHGISTADTGGFLTTTAC